MKKKLISTLLAGVLSFSLIGICTILVTNSTQGQAHIAVADEVKITYSDAETKDITDYNLGVYGETEVNSGFISMATGKFYTIPADATGEHRMFTDSSRSAWHITNTMGGIEFLVDFGESGLADGGYIQWAINMASFKIYNDKLVQTEQWNDTAHATVTLDKVYTGVQYVKIDSQFKYANGTPVARMITWQIGEDVYTVESANCDYCDDAPTFLANHTARILESRLQSITIN